MRRSRKSAASSENIRAIWPDSLLSGINRVAAIGGAHIVDPETALLIDHAFHAHALSDGLFDISSGRMKANLERRHRVDSR